MSRIDTLSATFTVAVVLSIGFFIYQSAQESESTQVKGQAKKEVTAKNPFPKVVLPGGTPKDRQSRKPITGMSMIKETSSPVLVSTTVTEKRLLTTNPPKPHRSPDIPPILEDVHFRFDRSGLSPETRTRLDRHVAVLKDQEWSVLIQGHTDQEGTIQQNLRVGLRRAQEVQKYLLNQGVSSAQMQVISLGEFQPTCMQLTPECQYQNRRVSFSLTRRDLRKEHPSTVTASAPPSPAHPPLDRRAAEIATEIASPTITHITEPPTPGDVTEDLGQSLASLTPNASLAERENTHPVPIEPIIPEPVHSTPPPTMLPDNQTPGHE